MAEVFAYLILKRPFLRQVPGPAYLFGAVRNAARQRFIHYWSRWVLLPTWQEIRSAEQMLAPDEPEDEGT